nr:hypothetical protein [Niabella ginsenosidivorans]
MPLPVARATSCTFGGKNLSDLYITNAYDRLNEEPLNIQPWQGHFSSGGTVVLKEFLPIVLNTKK